MTYGKALWTTRCRQIRTFFGTVRYETNSRSTDGVREHSSKYGLELTTRICASVAKSGSSTPTDGFGVG